MPVQTSHRNIYNKGIRAQILWREDELNTGDLLMVAKNNYFSDDRGREVLSEYLFFCLFCAGGW